MRKLVRDFLLHIWGFEFALVPCLLAYLVFDIPIVVRRITRKVYVPIYFAFFPFGYSDELYARYFDEDHYNMVGGPFSREEISNARTRIIWISVLSLILTMAISPSIAACFSYYFLDTEQQTQFFYFLAFVKAVTLAWSLYDLRWQYKITNVVPIGFIATIYVLYWVALLTIYDRGLKWISQRDSEGGFYAIANGLLDYIVYDIGVSILLVSLLGFLLPWRLTNGTGKPLEREVHSNEK